MHPDTLLAISRNNLLTSTDALKACGMQEEFAANLVLMQQASKTSLILRAGSPPVYDRPRSPKTGLNLSKTSNQGFFKGQIAKDLKFTRLIKDNLGKVHAIGHHKKDTEKLQTGEQNTVQLPIRLRDIVRELREPGGDLVISSFNQETNEIRFRYRKDHGENNFMGEFVLNLNEGEKYNTHYSRSWDKLESDSKYIASKDIIEKPSNLIISDKAWEQLYRQMNNKEFLLFYCDTVSSKKLKPAKVFADKIT
tara:strand:- start:4333 stop:5085 length:753 start_codon:yes stop_codon:yes gene_type:complete